MADQAERAARRADATLRMTVGRGLALCLALLAAGQRPVMAEERLRVAVHLHSTVSTGKAQPHQILQWAQQAGLDAVVLTDTLARTWEYGLPPWRWLIKRTVEEPSVMTYGVRRYLSDVADADRASPLMLVAGVEVAPTYYWRRSPLSRAGGELRNWHQHLLVVGLDAKGLQSLPQRHHPYGGDQGPAPHQAVIDAATASGGLVFWAHPETPHEGRHGSISEFTESYPHLLEQTHGYHGFAITYWGATTFVDPGGVWDRLLQEYVSGARAEPVWVLGELDWRELKERRLDQVTTDVLVAERTPQALLTAMRQGRMWATLRTQPVPLLLREFSASRLDGGAPAGPGQVLAGAGPVEFRIRGVGSGVPGSPSTIVVIGDGRVVYRERVEGSDWDIHWKDPGPPSRYYRLLVQDRIGLIAANPIFVRREEPPLAADHDRIVHSQRSGRGADTGATP